jgi:hypothetical protein
LHAGSAEQVTTTIPLDAFPDDYPVSLVEGFTVPDDGIDRDDPIVTKSRAWVAREGSKDKQYEMTRHDAAVLMEQLAGWPFSLYERRPRARRS